MFRRTFLSSLGVSPLSLLFKKEEESSELPEVQFDIEGKISNMDELIKYALPLDTWEQFNEFQEKIGDCRFSFVSEERFEFSKKHGGICSSYIIVYSKVPVKRFGDTSFIGEVVITIDRDFYDVHHTVNSKCATAVSYGKFRETKPSC